VYWIHKPDTQLVIDTDQSPEAVSERIGAEMAHVRSVVWSPAFGAQVPFVGVLKLPLIQMRVRHGYSNGFTRLLDGRIESAAEAAGAGSRLTLRFQSIRWIELLVRVVEVVLLGPVLAYALGVVWYAQRGGVVDWGATLAATAGAALPIALLVGIEWFARRLGDHDEQAMRRALRDWFPH